MPTIAINHGLVALGTLGPPAARPFPDRGACAVDFSLNLKGGGRNCRA